MWRDSIQQQGFYIFPPLFSGEELAALKNALSTSMLKRSRAGLRHATQIEQIADIARDQRLLAIAEGVLGMDAVPYHATLFEKTPDANWLVVWHQDTALPLTKKSERAGWGPWSVKDGVIYAHAPASALSSVLALRLQLDDSSIENGPLRVLPGTHNRGVLTDDAIHELSQQIAPVDCLAARGAVVAMRPMIVHASSKSLCGAPRRVLHIEYAAAIQIEPDMRLAVA